MLGQLLVPMQRSRQMLMLTPLRLLPLCVSIVFLAVFPSLLRVASSALVLLQPLRLILGLHVRNARFDHAAAIGRAEDGITDRKGDVEVPLAHERLRVVHLVVAAQEGNAGKRTEQRVGRRVVREIWHTHTHEGKEEETRDIHQSNATASLSLTSLA